MSGMDILGLGADKNMEKSTHNHIPDGSCCGGDNANSSKDHPIFAAVKSGYVGDCTELVKFPWEKSCILCNI